MTLPPGTQIGPYVIEAFLAAGGMGEVYRARDERLSRFVALKMIPGAYIHDASRLERFEQEARAAGTLSHPHILTVFDVGVHDGRPYLVVELLEGQLLRSAIDEKLLTVRSAVQYGVQIASGIAAAHERGIVHCDLKPENIFLTRDGLAKILDFRPGKTGRTTKKSG